MTELKPCPFCGGNAVYHKGYQRSDGEFIKGEVICEKCWCFKTSESLADYLGTIYHGFVGREIEQKVSETAIEEWNKRAVSTCILETRIERCPNGRRYIKCYQCGYEYDFSNCPPRWNYCPNCGAKVVE